MQLMNVAKKFEGYRFTLDKKRREIFDHLIYELAGRREEALVNHASSHSEAAIMNILIEQEIRLQAIESRLKEK